MTDIFPFEAWDPLDATSGADPGMIVSAQKREISNILKSYTGYYDLFAELIQNAMDAVERRAELANKAEYQGYIKISIDLRDQSVTVTDNGCGMDIDQFWQLLRPNFSFKTGALTRGSKGVGATYVAYGFNSLKVTTKIDGKVYSGRIERGRDWIEDSSGTISRPKIVHDPDVDPTFDDLDRGTSIRVRLTGDNIRPRNLGWTGAWTAKQWLVLLRLMTPIGGVYMCGDQPPKIQVEVTVIDTSGNLTTEVIGEPVYLFPHTEIARSADLREFIIDQKTRAAKGQDISKIPPKFAKKNGLWGEWTGAEILGDVESDCPVRPRLDAEERALARGLGLKIYVYLAFSTDLWDLLNDSTFELRKGSRVLRGGLQLATRHMPQGVSLTIPMTNNIGFQNLAHVIIHFDNAEPDLGRKGFQPEHAQLAEKIAVSAVTAFRGRYHLLRKPGVASIFGSEVKLQDWIRQQENHDVVALFNQMLSSGLIRGVQLIASSQYNQYDGLFRVNMEEPFDRFILSEENPLGVDEEIFIGAEGSLRTPAKVLEYKYNLDGLVEEIQAEVKAAGDIGLAVAWTMGKKWREMFDVTCLLDPDNVHHRHIHGTTHRLVHSMSGTTAFDVIILQDLVNYLQNPEAEIERQRQRLHEDD